MSKRSNLTRWAAIVFSFALCCTIIACSDDDDDDNGGDIAISGRVLNAQGQPVASANVLIEFTVVSQVQSLEAPHPLIIEPDPEVSPAAVGDSSCFEVFDRCGALIRTSRCENPCELKVGTTDPAPGLYHVEKRDCESLELTRDFDFWSDFREASDVHFPLAVTDADGRYSIPRCLIPLEISFECPASVPGTLCKITEDIILHAWKGVDQGSVAATITKTGTINASIQFEE